MTPPPMQPDSEITRSVLEQKLQQRLSCGPVLDCLSDSTLQQILALIDADPGMQQAQAQHDAQMAADYRGLLTGSASPRGVPNQFGGFGEPRGMSSRRRRELLAATPDGRAAMAGTRRFAEQIHPVGQAAAFTAADAMRLGAEAAELENVWGVRLASGLRSIPGLARKLAKAMAGRGRDAGIGIMNLHQVLRAVNRLGVQASGRVQTDPAALGRMLGVLQDAGVTHTGDQVGMPKPPPANPGTLPRGALAAGFSPIGYDPNCRISLFSDQHQAGAMSPARRAELLGSTALGRQIIAGR